MNEITFYKIPNTFYISTSWLTALEDTKENRIIQAERYLNRFSLVDMIGALGSRCLNIPHSRHGQINKKRISPTE